MGADGAASHWREQLPLSAPPGVMGRDPAAFDPRRRRAQRSWVRLETDGVGSAHAGLAVDRRELSWLHKR